MDIVLSVSVCALQSGVFRRRRRLGHFELRRSRQHLGETDTDTLNDGKQNGTANGTVARGLVATSDGESTTSEETGNDGVVGVLLLADALYGAVKGREEATPDAEVASEDRSSHLDGGDGADASLAVGGVAEPFDAVPDGATNGLKRRGQRLVLHRDDGPALPKYYIVHLWERHCGCGEGKETYSHAKGTAKVIENDPRAGIASVIHGCCGEDERAGKKEFAKSTGLNLEIVVCSRLALRLPQG